MGQGQSSPAVKNLFTQIAKQQVKPQVVDPVAVCNAKRVEAGQLKNDVAAKQKELDTCYPQEAEDRIVQKKIQDNQTFLDEKWKQCETIYNDMKRTWTLLKKVKNTTNISDEYVAKLRKERNDLESETKELEQVERRYRRNFLDNDPQGGVPLHILGLQTSDDRIMILFWISSLFILSIAAYYARTQYGFTWSKIAGLYFVPLTVAYYCITMYG